MANSPRRASKARMTKPCRTLLPGSFCRLAPGARQVRLLVSYELFGQNRYLPNGYVIITMAPPAPGQR